MFTRIKRACLRARRHLLPFAVLVALCAADPARSFACACGCGIFDVDTSTLMPSGAGGLLSFEYDYNDQNRNWSGASKSDAANNDDKHIVTAFYTAGLQYMFNRVFGLQVKVPYWDRDYTADTGGGVIETFHDKSIGDIRVSGIYTGFSADMSSGVTFGLKLPTGRDDAANFDRDTQIGTGSTDLLLGGFHRGHIPVQAAGWDWFAQGSLEQPFITTGGYRPGTEFNAALGVDYDAGPAGFFSKLAPVLRLVGSHRLHDGGVNAEPADSGYTRLLAAPGLELSLGRTTLYTDVELPLYDHVRGNQLVSRPLFKAVISHPF
ncbi:MAG: hypothetical protein GC185_01625 [Alphaproteobacteria bacterium]|nr:hypothetical protein [Alphaproteobacteria bacterium]